MVSHLLPGRGVLVPERVRAARFARRVRDAAAGAPQVLHLTHAGCLDGATCDALVKTAYGPASVETLFLEPHETVAALGVVAQEAGRGRRLVVSDLSFQKGEGERVLALVARLRFLGWRVSWRDHHHKQWEGAPLEKLSQEGEFTVDFSGTECGATLVQKELLPRDEFAAELARVVRDHDLWLRQDPRSVRLHAAATEAESEPFVARLLETRDLADPRLVEWADAEETRRRALTELGVSEARIVTGRRAVVGVAFGRLPTNEVLHTLEERGAHLGVLIKPDGAFSLRSRKDVPVCHRIAARFGGGGHPNASGGRLDIPLPLLPLHVLLRGDMGPGRALVRAAVREVDGFLLEGVE